MHGPSKAAQHDSHMPARGRRHAPAPIFTGHAAASRRSLAELRRLKITIFDAHRAGRERAAFHSAIAEIRALAAFRRGRGDRHEAERASDGPRRLSLSRARRLVDAAERRNAALGIFIFAKRRQSQASENWSIIAHFR